MIWGITILPKTYGLQNTSKDSLTKKIEELCYKSVFPNQKFLSPIMPQTRRASKGLPEVSEFLKNCTSQTDQKLDLNLRRGKSSQVNSWAVAPLVWVLWIPGNPSIFEQWVPEPISFGIKWIKFTPFSVQIKHEMGVASLEH